jgi:hypothetical protein
MSRCEKHGCELKPLLTSEFCPRCDEEASVNVDLGKVMKHIYSHDADGKELGLRQAVDANRQAMDAQAAHQNQQHGLVWYHSYRTCGTDANGSDVDDMDVCMGLSAKLEAIRLWQQAGLLDSDFAERKRYVAGQMSDAEMAELEDDARSINAVAYGTAASNFARTVSSELTTDLRRHYRSPD